MFSADDQSIADEQSQMMMSYSKRISDISIHFGGLNPFGNSDLKLNQATISND